MRISTLLKSIVVLAACAGSARAEDLKTVFVFSDTAANRAAVSALAGVSGIDVAVATSGDTTVVSLAGNGFERGLVLDGLRSADRKAFRFSGSGLATPAGAAGLDHALELAGYTVPVIVLVPDPKFPDKCKFAICLPPDWMAKGGDGVGNGLVRRGNGTGVGGAITLSEDGGIVGNGIIRLSGSGTSVGGGLVINGLKIPQRALAPGGADGSGI